MITLLLNETKVLCPVCYEELTTGTYQRIIREWDPDEPDLAKRDFFRLFSILTKTNYKAFAQTSENEVTLWNAISWFIDQPFKFSKELPKVLLIGDKMVEVPKKVSSLSSGQNVLLRQAIFKCRFMEEAISIATAICMQPGYDNTKFDVERALELEKTILEMPVYLTYPIGFFLLMNARLPGMMPTNGWRQTPRSLKQTLKRMLPLWPKSTASGSLTIYH